LFIKQHHKNAKNGESKTPQWYFTFTVVDTIYIVQFLIAGKKPVFKPDTGQEKIGF